MFAWVPNVWEIAMFGGIALLLFGNRLPGVARSMGMSVNEFKKGLKESSEEETEQKKEEKPA